MFDKLNVRQLIAILETVKDKSVPVILTSPEWPYRMFLIGVEESENELEPKNTVELEGLDPRQEE